MKIDIHVYHHFDSNGDIQKGLRKIEKDIQAMSEKLQAALTALTDEVTDTNGKLDSINTFVTGLPDVVAAAVADALAAADVEDDDAADLIDTARTTISDKVDAVLAATNANPKPGDPPTDPVPEGGQA